jgi:hypothetical protein
MDDEFDVPLDTDDPIIVGIATDDGDYFPELDFYLGNDDNDLLGVVFLEGDELE